MKRAALTFILIVGLAGGYYFVKKQAPSNKFQTNSYPQTSPTTSPQPFAELTIPYLRSRDYESTLGERQQISQNPNYTSYLTSYTSDNLNINGLLTVPNSNMPEGGYPAIIFIHGYIPPEQYETTANYNSYVDYLARNEYVVFKIDLRGHGQSEGVPSGAYFSGDYVIDTLNAYAALQSADFVNPQKIGLWGHSMAGNVVFRALVTRQNIPASVIWAGAVYTYEDMQEYGISDNSYDPPPEDSPRSKERNRLREIHGNFDPNSEFWQSVVPTNYLDGVTGALQINHATNDPVVNIAYSRNLVYVLEDANINYELNEHESGGHNITGAAFTAAMQNTVEFFDTYLK